MSLKAPFSGSRTAAKRKKVNLGGRNYDTARGHASRSGVKKMKEADVLNPADVTPPAWLSPQQVKLFCAVRDKVLEQDTVRATDLYALELLCTDYVVYHQYCETIAEEGLMVTEISRSGRKTKPHPLLYLRENMKRSLREYFRAFGMTPVTRRLVAATVAAEEKHDDPEGEEWKGVLNS